MSSEGHDPSASGSGQAEAADPMIGQIIDKRYRITSKLGEGGMGEVYAADHLRIARSVAIKLLRAEVLTNEEAVKRFEQEAMTASSIGHDNIIRIEDSGKLDDGRIYLAMELLAGMPFNDLIDEPGPPIPADRLLHILIQTCHGLAAAHEKGIVHRDMKPENIYITQTADGSDVPKLLDFGIAKVSQAEGENHLTRTGTIFGTPFYMAPEQALGQAVDHRVDIYAMGVIMYEVFCGEVPFGGESFMGILTQHITAEPMIPSATAQQNGRMLVPGVEEVILRAMKKEPAQRYQTMDDLCQALVPLYRALAGSGMSTYMAAHAPPPATGPNPAARPATGGYPGHGTSPAPAPVSVRDEHSQPHHLPHNPMAPPNPMGGTAPPVPPSGGYVAHPASASSVVFPAKKGRGGLIAIVLLVLLAAGGGAAFFLLSEGADEESVASSDDPNDTQSDPENTPNDTIAPAAESDAGQSADPGNTTDPTGGPANQGTGDAGAGGETPDDPDPVPPKPKLVTVLLSSKPVGARVYRDGKKIGVTPMNVKVDPDDPTSLLLKRRRYKDEEVTLDGAEGKVTARMDRKGRRPDKTEPDPVTPPPPPPPPKKDPCKRNPNLPECMLE